MIWAQFRNVFLTFLLKQFMNPTNVLNDGRECGLTIRRWRNTHSPRGSESCSRDCQIADDKDHTNHAPSSTPNSSNMRWPFLPLIIAQTLPWELRVFRMSSNSAARPNLASLSPAPQHRKITTSSLFFAKDKSCWWRDTNTLLHCTSSNKLTTTPRPLFAMFFSFSSLNSLCDLGRLEIFEADLSV